jgi:hypothetical protein
VNSHALYSSRRRSGSRFNVNPMLLRVSHSTTAGNLACRSGFEERTGTRTVTEGLGSVAALSRIPRERSVNFASRTHAAPHSASISASPPLSLVAFAALDTVGCVKH